MIYFPYIDGGLRMQALKSTIQFLSSHLTFWDQLTPDEKRCLIENTQPAQYEKGTELRTGADNCIGMIIIRSGRLRVYMLSPEGRDITLFRVVQGEVCVLSASCVLNAITFDVCIDAESETNAFVLKTDIYQKLTENNIYVREFGYELATRRFSEVMWTMQQILFMSFNRRLALFLVGEMEKNNGSPKLELTHEQIAKYTGSAREVVTRMLNYFANDRIVSLSRGCITVIDKQKLEEIAEKSQ